MTKLKWNRDPITSVLNTEYYLNSKTGFDKSWHDKIKASKKEYNLGTHKTHDWQPIKLQTGPHYGKLICKTCNDKFIQWLPKSILSNT